MASKTTVVKHEFYSEIIEETDNYRIFAYDYPKIGNRKTYKKATLTSYYDNFENECSVCGDLVETGYEYISHPQAVDCVLFAPKHYFVGWTCQQQSCVDEKVSKYDYWNLNSEYYWEYKHIADTNINKFKELIHKLDGKPENDLMEKIENAKLEVAFGLPIGWKNEEALHIVKQVWKIVKKVTKESNNKK